MSNLIENNISRHYKDVVKLVYVWIFDLICVSHKLKFEIRKIIDTKIRVGTECRKYKKGCRMRLAIINELKRTCAICTELTNAFDIRVKKINVYL